MTPEESNIYSLMKQNCFSSSGGATQIFRCMDSFKIIQCQVSSPSEPGKYPVSRIQIVSSLRDL